MFDPALVGRLPAAYRRRSAGRSLLRLAGPAAVVAVAYVDPGNFATNVQAGAALGTRLLWVVVAASLVAVLVQYLSAKVGAVTGRSLPELCRDRAPRPVVRLLWLQAEVVAIATDLAEVVGGAVALQLLVGLPLPVGGGVVAAGGLALLAVRSAGRERFQAAVAGLLLAVVLGFAYQLARVGTGFGESAAGLVPGFGSGQGLLLATGIVGATVMPHAVYLHSALAASARGPRTPLPGRLRALLGAHRRDIALALGVATVANAAILLVAAGAFPSGSGIEDLEGAYAGLRALDPGVGTAFGLALLVSGLAASGVGTLAGEVVMQGFLRRRVPLVLRRLVTLAPAVAVLCTPLDPTRALVLSQVVLSFGVPFALVPLLVLTARRSVMGGAVNHPAVTALAGACAAAVVALDGVLVAQLFT